MNNKRKSVPYTAKHQRVRDALRHQLSEGRYPPGSRLPTEIELPKQFRVGKQTIVRALNELVREGLIVRRRGDGTYVADRRKPPLIPGRLLRIGIVWHRSVLPERLMTSFQGAMTRGVLAAWGFENIQPEWARVGELEPTRAIWTSVERGLTVECIGEAIQMRDRHPDLSVIQTGRFDGLLVLSIVEEPWLMQLLSLAIPTVLIDILNDRFGTLTDMVYVDPLPGYRAAARRFAARGLTRIHFVGGYMGAPLPPANPQNNTVDAPKSNRAPRIDPDSHLRLSAYRQAMDECGLAVDDKYIHFAWYGAEGVRPLASKLFALPDHARPEAVICHSIDQATHLMEAFAEHGVMLQAAGASETVCSEPVLGIHIDGKRMGEVGAALLVSRLQQTSRPPLRVGVPMRLTDDDAPVALNAEGHCTSTVFSQVS